ncbi:ankyrin repeat domain-containing protein 6 [Astyanax mexicanus]|uniref:ankyrin repeat domain-containing protein 6 n=1 Tax=Astyanax mexicanus TaxID=7994 RepID=UPI0020CACECA|nr:ankyrin repeat domain-containing protein 6 [Astyanax mexicanus]
MHSPCLSQLACIGLIRQLGAGHQTALHRAAVVGNREVISALVQGGCALDLQDKDLFQQEGNTALHEVAWHGFSQSVKVLVKAGANLHIQNKGGSTPLHLACQNGHAQSARVLLLGGSVPDIKNKAGDTCLHIAARYNHVVVVKILLGAFCSVAEKNQVGDTALHVAAALNHKKTVSLLLEAGADCSIKNNAGRTALDKARDNNNREVSLLLARSNQVQRFTRGRTVRKRRDVLRAQRRAQSVPRDEVLPGKDSPSVGEDTHSSDRVIRRIAHPLGNTTSSPHTRRKIRRHKERSEHTSQRETLLQTATKRPGHSSSSPQEEERHPNGNAYQLYTLYRDIDGCIKQAPANGCNCKPLIKKLEHQLKATKKEMRSQIHMVQEQMNCKLGRIDCQSKQQIKVLEKMTQERVSAERMECRYRINQRATLERTENQTRQASAAGEVKNWCMSKLQEMEVQLPAESGYYKLVQSPSTDHSVLETDPERLPLLSVISADSGSSLATYVNLLPNPAATGSAGKSPEFDDLQGRKYFEVKLDGSPSRPTCLSDNYQNISQHCATPPIPAHPVNPHRPLIRQLANADPQWLNPEQRESECRRGQSEELSYSSTSSSLSPSSRGFDDSDPEPSRLQAWHHRKHLRDRIRAHRANAQPGSTLHTLEFFTERPPEPSFIQERANLHAVEVTQRFFETVSTQLERWYERKIQEAQRAVEHRAQQDRAGLLHRIDALEEELRRLRAREPNDCLNP